jgi:hypothetical protein
MEFIGLFNTVTSINMPNMEKAINKAIVDVVNYSTSLNPTKVQTDRYVKALSLLNIVLPTTAQKAWREINTQLDAHHVRMYQ